MLNIDKIKKSILDDSVPIGSIVMVELHLPGAIEPPKENFIRLRAGLIGVGQYNEGKLTVDTTTGSAPLVSSTAVIDDEDSPLYGQTVRLVETEERFFRAGGTIGNVENDQMQRITGSLGDSYLRANAGDGGGAFSFSFLNVIAWGAGTAGSKNFISFNSANSPSARVSSTNNGETRSKNQRIAVYIRHK